MKLYALMSSAHYEQDGHETITIRVDDEGGGPYVVLETEGWAMNDRSEVDQLVRAIMRELEYAEARTSEEFQESKT